MSAALQTAPHQHTALASSPLGSPASHQYRPSSSREPYNAQQSSTTSPSSRRPPSRKTTENAPSPAYHLGPGFGNQFSVEQQTSSSSEQLSNMPPVAPPRSSSNHQSAGSRRGAYANDKPSNSPRRAQGEPSRSGSRGNPTTNAENGYQSRKPVNSHGAQDSPRSGSRDGRSNTTNIPVRSAHGTPSKQTQEATDNLSKAIAAAEDANGRHHAMAQDDAAPPPISTGDERRGGRSRHDQSTRSHKGTTKFGDFILGNTIGEGEFGKVKLGWKQDSNVQVCMPVDFVGFFKTKRSIFFPHRFET